MINHEQTLFNGNDQTIQSKRTDNYLREDFDESDNIFIEQAECMG